MPNENFNVAPSNLLWFPAPLPENEGGRLESLRQYEILDTPSEEAFDRITRLAAAWFKMPISLISLVDDERQWFKSHHGLETGETPRGLAFCSYTILHDEVFVVPDASRDVRFAHNPLVTGGPEIKFYAGAPLKNKDGYNLGTICIIDQKTRSELTEEDKRILHDLAAMVVDEMELKRAGKSALNLIRRMKKVQKALRRAKEQAESFSRMKSDFIASVSHELRTPLHAILGLNELLENSAAPAEKKEYCGLINSSGNNLLQLVNGILDIAKIESGKMELDKTSCDLKTLLEETIGILKVKAEEKNNRIILEWNCDISSIINADSLKLKQIFTNLIGNAVKFTEGGIIKITVTAAKISPRKNNWKIEVEDNGIGVPEKSLPFIFQKFTQGGADISGKYGGTGLGLAITREMVKLMDGIISVASIKGKGSIFGVELPLEESILQPAKIQEKNLSLRPGNILLVDDDAVNRIIARQFLERQGCKITSAENGREAVDLYKTGNFAAVLMDCHMPEMDGYQATAEIRKYETASGGKQTPIIALTADAMLEQRILPANTGMDDYIAKPFSAAALISVLSRWM